jgi:hypothetical protein
MAAAVTRVAHFGSTRNWSGELPVSLLRLGVQKEDDSGSVGGVSYCWARVGRTGGKAESTGSAARVNGGGNLTGPFGLGWAMRECGRQNRLAGPGPASS